MEFISLQKTKCHINEVQLVLGNRVFNEFNKLQTQARKKHFVMASLVHNPNEQQILR